MGNLCIDFKKLSTQESIAYGQGRLRSYDFVRPIKSNRVSTVWLVQSKIHKTFCALKLTRKLVASRNNVVHLPTNEQSILGSINHNLISNIIEAFQDISNLYIVLEYMPCGSLREYLTYSGCLTQSQTRFVIICLLIALEYLHKRQIAHLDIKPENLLIDKQGYFRLCDFNLSVDCKTKPKNDKKVRLAGVGTYGYQAPEINSNPKMIGKQSDLYSVGVMCAQMLTGINKRNTDNFSSAFLKERLKERVNISNICIDFISKLLEEDPLKRLGSRGNFEQIWKHPWLQVSHTERLQYICKQVPSFVHDEYRKNKQINEEQANVTEQNDEVEDELVDRLKLEDLKFQGLFKEFKTIVFKPNNKQSNCAVP